MAIDLNALNEAELDNLALNLDEQSLNGASDPQYKNRKTPLGLLKGLITDHEARRLREKKLGGRFASPMVDFFLFGQEKDTRINNGGEVASVVIAPLDGEGEAIGPPRIEERRSLTTGKLRVFPDRDLTKELADISDQLGLGWNFLRDVPFQQEGESTKV